MADPHDRTGVARPEGGFWWLKGRAGRAEYWSYVAVLTLASWMFSGSPLADLVLTLLLVLVQLRRLHDAERSAWWLLPAQLGPVAAAIPLMAMGRGEVGIGLGVVLELAAIVWIGALAGTPGDNRFGPAPTSTLRRLFTGR